VRLTQRHIVWCRTKALPNQLDQPKPFLSGKLKYLSEVRITHKDQCNTDSPKAATGHDEAQSCLGHDKYFKRIPVRSSGCR